MSDSGFARLPEPPYHVVIFSSRRRAGDDADYALAAQRMIELAAQQPGFLGVESARDDAGFGITVSYWRDEAAIGAWRDQPDHADTRAQGRRHWYDHYEVRIAKVERAYGSRTAT
ncbi:MAG: antibiotic biosynthesis monooxygenase [Pseudomonadota bacterium]|nr:antibiotic biosynthesis monooxygenase [Pseudomonadota bacterium]